MRKFFRNNGSLICFILGIVCLLILTIIAALYEKKNDIKNYNNGVCINCQEGTYHLVSSEHIKNSGDRYIYECDNCKYTIETHSRMK